MPADPDRSQDAKSSERACKCGAMLVSNVTGVAFPCPFCGDKGGKDTNASTLLAAAEILRSEAAKDTSRSQNDQAELRIAAAVCEGVAARA